MKSRMKAVGAIMVMAIAILSYTQVNYSKQLDHLLLENIDELAAGESETSGECIGSGSVVCPYNNKQVAHVRVYYSHP